MFQIALTLTLWLLAAASRAATAATASGGALAPPGLDDDQPSALTKLNFFS
jgi:hypothetical protein